MQTAFVPPGQPAAPAAKPKLLVLELWGLGDLIIATPFLRAAVERFDTTLLAKSFALDLRSRLWPAVKVVPFHAPWTTFKVSDKYRLWRWPLLEMIRLRRNLVRERFDVGLSARWDPRNHVLLKFFGARERLGFPRLGSRYFLTRPLASPEPEAHRYDYWRLMGEALGLKLASRDQIIQPAVNGKKTVLIHTGAGQPVRVWPLKYYQRLVARLRENGMSVQIACDPEQREWWLAAGEPGVATPANVTELIALTDRVGAFVGNDSGPGHLAAFCGVPTFTIFGPQLPEWFAPLHPKAEWIEGRACPYKPCSDYCRYPVPFCLSNVGEEAVWECVKKFISACSGVALS